MIKIKVILIGLISTSLGACSSVELIHVPVGCLGLPYVDVQYTQVEAESLSNEIVDKIVRTEAIYKTRINSQCAINKKHDELHGDDDD